MRVGVCMHRSRLGQASIVQSLHYCGRGTTVFCSNNVLPWICFREWQIGGVDESARKKKGYRKKKGCLESFKSLSDTQV